MFCKKCGSELADNSKFCTSCGAKIQEEDSKQVNNNNIDEKQRQDINFDEKLIKAYIGKKADEMYNNVKNGGFSICAFSFGLIYLTYRKMYLISLVLAIIICIATLMSPVIGACFGAIPGIMFCPLYKWDITRKLRKVKQKNPNASKEQLLNIARDKGGTSVLASVIFFVVYLLVCFLVLLLSFLLKRMQNNI